METKRGRIQEKKPVPREIGSNLTGTALSGKPGHERDVNIKTFEPAQQAKSQSDSHIKNTDTLLGDVHPIHRNQKSQEQHNGDQQNS